MALFEKGNKVGNRFTSENQPKNSGRKPALYKKLKELTGKKVDYELSKEDYYKVIRYLMERTPGELKKILENAKDDTNGSTPVWVINVILVQFSRKLNSFKHNFVATPSVINVTALLTFEQCFNDV